MKTKYSNRSAAKKIVMESNNPMLYTRITYVRELPIARRPGKVKIKNWSYNEDLFEKHALNAADQNST